MRKPLARVLLCATLTPLTLTPAFADNANNYQLPPPGLQAIVDAPRAPQLLLSPQRNLAAFLQMPSLPSIAIVAQPELKLAGVRLHPRTYSASRFQFASDIWLKDLASGKEIRIQGLPQHVRIAHSSWSPDQRFLAFTHHAQAGVELWLIDVAKAQARRASRQYLNTVFSDGFDWLPDSHQLFVHLKPAQLPALPSALEVPSGPNVQQSEQSANHKQLRTYQDLLKNPRDVALFEHYASVQLGLLDIRGQLRPLGKPALFMDSQVSPDGKYVLTRTLQAPYSYAVPARQFAHKIEIRDLHNKLVHAFPPQALVEGLPVGADAVAPGMRHVQWRADAPASVVWAEALDGGDPNRQVALRDQVQSLAAPFTGSPQTLAQLSLRLQQIYWGRNDLALVEEGWHKTRQEKLWRIAPQLAQASPARLIYARSSEDRYADPGNPVMRKDAQGQRRLQFIAESGPQANTILLTGDGASKDGDRPFLDSMNLDDLRTQRLFQSQAPYYEKVVAVLNLDGSQFLSTRETPDEQPNYYVRNSAKPSELKALTQFPHPYPQLKGVQQELIHYQRKDGIALTGKLYLPPAYDAKRDGRLPLVMWAYPQEFKSNAAASQVTGSPYRFNAISYNGVLPFLAAGYAVLDHPAMPIIGEGGKEPNDQYLSQLIGNAEAAVDEVVRRGVADKHRIAIGGHSYGAFMTANLLAHTRLFAAGIARSGAYNRTLTPFGFQLEERNFWQAKEVYQAMSPFHFADNIKDPLLFIHGEQDNNPGTFPVQSERMFYAVKGVGGKARLVMLPNESHGYRARESILHMLAEMHEWLDKYVKNAPAPSK